MASAFGHAFAAVALGKAIGPVQINAKLLLLAMVCSILPDADVVSFSLGIPYEHVLGHRGITHSLLFALVTGILFKVLFYRKIKFFSKAGILLSLFFALATASHAVLDAITNGGLGVAFFAPFDNSRYFFPWRPVKVSPIGAANFFSDRGLQVILSEAIWIGIPSAVIALIGSIIRKKVRKS